MYINVLQNTIEALLKSNKANIVITLPTIFFRRLQTELNSGIKINNILPIETITITEFTIYDRTVKIVEGSEMTKEFQVALDQEITKLSNTITRIDGIQTNIDFTNSNT